MALIGLVLLLNDFFLNESIQKCHCNFIADEIVKSL